VEHTIHSTRQHRSRLFLLLMLVLIAAAPSPHAAPLALDNPQVYDFRPDTGDSGPCLPVGTLAPDFILPTLESVLKIADADAPPTVRLSSFHGKQPLVLFLSGYT